MFISLFFLHLDPIAHHSKSRFVFIDNTENKGDNNRKERNIVYAVRSNMWVVRFISGQSAYKLIE